MLRYGTEPIPACPANLLVFNEPNAVEPWGGPVTPAEAAVRVAAIEQQCPETRLIVGNVSADDWRWNGGWGRGQDWLRYFLSEYSLRYGRSFSATLGVHCFETVSGWCSTELGRMRTTYSGPMWVTEFAVVNTDVPQFAALLDYIRCCGRFERYAAYTNREPESGQGWELGRTVWLVDESGLTPKGQLYSEE